jgi:hypothetical protein
MADWHRRKNMKFDCTKGDQGTVYDVEGNLIPWALRGDTVTGKVVCAVRDQNNNPVLNDTSTEVREITALYKAPLRIDNYVRGSGW